VGRIDDLPRRAMEVLGVRFEVGRVPELEVDHVGIQRRWREDAFENSDDLTERETDVLKLMTSGISNREIAKALGIGDGTVRNHVSSIFSKLGVSDRTKAVLYALQKRLV
jgi:DNA-binding NarL/FixJ family response regulator